MQQDLFHDYIHLQSSKLVMLVIGKMSYIIASLKKSPPLADYFTYDPAPKCCYMDPTSCSLPCKAPVKSAFLGDGSNLLTARRGGPFLAHRS